MNVVVTDNDAALLKSLEIVLGGEGHRVRVFSDPHAACRYLAHGGELDVLVLDYLMPGMNGFDLLERVRTRRTIDFTVILISGHTDSVDPESLGCCGVDHFLAKPLDLHQLCRLVDGGGAETGPPAEPAPVTRGNR